MESNVETMYVLNCIRIESVIIRDMISLSPFKKNRK